MKNKTNQELRKGNIKDKGKNEVGNNFYEYLIK